jgi:hypothetical protein
MTKERYRVNKLTLIVTIGFLLMRTITFAQWNITNVTLLTNNVLQFEKTEFDIEITGAFTNPFNASDISIDMAIMSPTAVGMRLPCYYVSGDGTSSKWKARFAARESGVYSYYLELQKGGVVKATSATNQFTSNPSATDGFLTKKDNWSFQFDSGKPFRGIGENVAWEGRSWENENYNYEYFLGKLAQNGGNYFRTWMSVWNLPLEWKTVVDTKRYTNTTEYFHPQGIERMDELVALCDSLGLYMMLTLGWHGELQTADRWNVNIYNTINGGPAATPSDFFTSTTAKTQYKNRLRYIVARWGYSTNIGAWEFFNEIDNAAYNGTESTIAIAHSAITLWHTDMSDYLQSIDPYNHLITTSVSHRELTGLFNVPNIDFIQKHIYKSTGTIQAAIKDVESRYNKPFVTGEFGYDWDWNNITSSNGPNLDFDFKRGLWYGLFSPTPVLPLSWWWEFFDARGTSNYIKGVGDISDQIALAGQGNYTEITVTSPVLSLEGYGLKSGNKYFIYLVNTNTANNSNRTVTFPATGSTTYTVKSFNPENLSYTDLSNVTVSSNAISISNLSFEAHGARVLILTPEGDVSGIQMPFNSPFNIPGKIEAEDFDKGGEGVAYHDLENANAGNQYRLTEGVDIEVCSEGGYDVTDIISGEWMEYAVNIAKSGLYTIEARVASAIADNSFRLQVDGKSIGEIKIPGTGGAQNFQTVSFTNIFLNSGNSVLKLISQSSNYAINYLDIKLTNEAPGVGLTSPVNNQQFEAPVTITLAASANDPDGSVNKVEFYANEDKVGTVSSSPYQIGWVAAQGSYTIVARAIDDQGLVVDSSPIQIVVKPSQQQHPFPLADVPHAIPGKIEAEYFDQGADGIAFHDLTAGNIKSDYRPDADVDLEVCSDTDGGYNLADIQNGEWVEYTVDVEEAGKHDFSFRVATQMANQVFSVQLNNQNVADNISVPNTGGWQTWQTIKRANVKLSAGVNVLRLVFASEFFNLNYFNVEKSNVVTSTDVNEDTTAILYPNPSKENFIIIFPAPVRIITIEGIDGRKVSQEKPTQAQRNFVSERLAPGLYTIAIEYLSGKKEFIKAIITQ